MMNFACLCKAGFCHKLKLVEASGPSHLELSGANLHMPKS